jgi:hypothetical protein
LTANDHIGDLALIKTESDLFQKLREHLQFSPELF